MTLGDRAIIFYSFTPPLGASSKAYETWPNVYSELEFGGLCNVVHPENYPQNFLVTPLLPQVKSVYGESWRTLLPTIVYNLKKIGVHKHE